MDNGKIHDWKLFQGQGSWHSVPQFYFYKSTQYEHFTFEISLPEGIYLKKLQINPHFEVSNEIIYSLVFWKLFYALFYKQKD